MLGCLPCLQKTVGEMVRDLRIRFLLMFILHAELMCQQDLGQDLPPQLQKTVEEVLAGKYLNALLDILQFQSMNMWTTESANKIMAYFQTQNIVITYSSLQVSMKNYLESLLYQPKVLLSEFRQMSHQHFQTAMKYLFESKQDHLVYICFGLSNTTLNSVECVDILSQVLRVSSMTYLQLRTIASLPKDLPEDAFRNLSTVFKDLYDRITASAQKALYDWMTQILQKSYNASDTENSTSWVSAENLWILGRFMVHLPLEEIRKINPSDMRLFISYDNATKQLDTVYDITPALARAFLERINVSGFDMRNTSTLYRQVT
ncbi:hypothetical protein lerEdw1_018463 [Lerista edwardsae]|nr:hypothetical protein lerEdw1_018463 [Lerista edwardsae]